MIVNHTNVEEKIMGNTIIGKQVYSVQYGSGTITKEEDGLIWVDFEDQNKKNVCYQATAAFSKERTFLVSTDPIIAKYIEFRKNLEAEQNTKELAIKSLRYLKINENIISDFIVNNTIYLINGDSFTKVQDVPDDKLINGIKWYTKYSGNLVYAAFAVPNDCADKVITYAFLYINPNWRGIEERFLKIKGNLAYAYSFFQNFECYDNGQDRPLGLHLSKGGAYALPIPFINNILDIVEMPLRPFKK